MNLEMYSGTTPRSTRAYMGLPMLGSKPMTSSLSPNSTAQEKHLSMEAATMRPSFLEALLFSAPPAAENRKAIPMPVFPYCHRTATSISSRLTATNWKSWWLCDHSTEKTGTEDCLQRYSRGTAALGCGSDPIMLCYRRLSAFTLLSKNRI